MPKIEDISWSQVDDAARACAIRNAGAGFTGVYGVPSGGSVVAPFVAKHMQLPVVCEPDNWVLVVDDLVDSGRTLDAVVKLGHNGVCDALFRKPTSPQEWAPGARVMDGWLRFPWEVAAAPEDAVVRILQYLGEDVTRDGLKGTPARVLKALTEMTEGMHQDPADILKRQFELGHDEMVVLKGIPFTSLCEHHMLPFSGVAHVAYIPDGKRVVGLSKMARLVLCFAKRLQIQERMTGQVVDAIMEHLKPLGAACVIKAEHSCMSCRGVRLPDTSFITSALRGVLFSDKSARLELMALLGD